MNAANYLTNHRKSSTDLDICCFSETVTPLFPQDLGQVMTFPRVKFQKSPGKISLRPIPFASQ